MATAAEFTKLEVGLQGKGKVGKWLPIRAEASELPPGEAVELQAAFSDPTGDTCVEIADAGMVSPNGDISLSGVFRIGRLRGAGTVSIVSVSTGNVLIESAVKHGSDESAMPDAVIQGSLKLHRLNVQTVLTFGDVTGIEELVRNAATYASDDGVFLDSFQLANINDLPDQPRALESVDLILITDSFNASLKQAAAIRSWTRLGGRLVVSAAQDVKLFTTSVLGKWVAPLFGVNEVPITIRDLTSLQSVVSGASRLETNRASWPMAVMTSDQLSFEAESLNGPIIGTRSIGAGIITFVAVDLNRKPVKHWRSLPQFYEVLILGGRLSRQSSEIVGTSRISQTGVSDIATQLLAGVDAGHPAEPWSTWGIMGIIAAYLALIGPVDYLLVTRLLKRPHLTWITFPTMIVSGAVLLAYMADSGTAQSVSQIHVVDVIPDAKEGEKSVLTRSWMSLSVPQTMRLNLSVESTLNGLGTGSEDASLTWAGRPEDVYGGIYRSGGIGLGRQAYSHSQSQPGSLGNVPLLVKGARSFYSEHGLQASESVVSSELSASGFGLLSGTLENQLPGAVSDWVLVYGNRAYQVSSSSDLAVLDPGETWTADSDDVFATDLRAFLTGARIVPEDPSSRRGSSQVITPYDAKSTDAKYIVTIASLFDSVGGAGYAGLSQTLLKTMDLSDTVELNHALLIGTLDAVPALLAVDGKPVSPAHSQTVLRVLLPVHRQPAAEMADTKEDIEKRSRQND